MRLASIAVLGAGSWGTALANAVQRAGRAVTLWARNADSARAISHTGENPRLPGIRLDPRLTVTASLERALDADAILVVVPAQAVRSVVSAMPADRIEGRPLVICAKGIERVTRKFMTDILAECAPDALPAILSGPSFAADVARGLPTAVTLAARDEQLAADLAMAIGSAAFRPYQSTDLRGVEIGGAAKNVLAIAAGIVAGRRLGASAAAALTTRGFAELVRFGRFHGARPETLTGLSGLGDLILTCSGPQSRNFALGQSLGSGMDLKHIAGSTSLAEGAFTASVLAEMAQEHGIDMPIVQAVAAILDGRLTIDEAIDGLLTRPIRTEL